MLRAVVLPGLRPGSEPVTRFVHFVRIPAFTQAQLYTDFEDSSTRLFVLPPMRGDTEEWRLIVGKHRWSRTVSYRAFIIGDRHPCYPYRSPPRRRPWGPVARAE